MFRFEEVHKDNQSELIFPLVEMINNYYLEQTKYKYTADKDYIHKLLLDTLDKSSYCVVFKQDVPIGYFRFTVDNQEGLVEEYLYVEYLYIKPEHRSTTVIGFVYATISKIQAVLNVNKIYADIINNSTSIINYSKIDNTVVNSIGISFDTLNDNFIKQLVNRYYKKEDNV